MSRAVAQLPEGYHPIYEIDLQKNKKMSRILNLSSDRGVGMTVYSK